MAQILQSNRRSFSLQLPILPVLSTPVPDLITLNRYGNKKYDKQFFSNKNFHKIYSENVPYYKSDHNLDKTAPVNISLEKKKQHEQPWIRFRTCIFKPLLNTNVIQLFFFFEEPSKEELHVYWVNMYFLNINNAIDHCYTQEWSLTNYYTCIRGNSRYLKKKLNFTFY